MTCPSLARTQDPIWLSDWSELNPDLTVVQGEILTYIKRHPRPDDVQLIVEVADSTLKQDCEVRQTLRSSQHRRVLGTRS